MKTPATAMGIYSKGWSNQVEKPLVAEATFIN